MRRILSLAWVLVLIPAGAWAQQWQKPSPGQPHASQDAPALPPTLINSPPVQPVVRMQNGLLSIDAPNSTLGDVLSGIQAATGAVVEGPAPGDRVAVRLGPGEARDVIASLLRGTAYNFIILGSPENPRAVTRIVLTKTSPSRGRGGARMAPRPAPPPPEPYQAEEDSAAADSGQISPPPRRPGMTRTPPRAAPTSPTPQPKNEPKPENRPTTPEELFRQLLPSKQAPQRK
jgi:hypothetical protein